MPLTPVLSAHWDELDSYTLDGYRRHGGYDALAPAFAKQPDDVIQLIKDSGLRGRGGAGFPTGMKWGFVPQGDGKPHYLVVNADESEPGACKDVPLMLANPHSLVEGVIIASYAIRANHAFIYIRGEVPHAIRRVAAAVREAYAAGFSVATSQDRVSTSRSRCTPVLAPTSAVKRRRCSTPSRDSGASRGSSPRSQQLPACTRHRRSSTTSRRSPASRRSSPTEPTGTPRTAVRSPRASSSSPSPATSNVPASSRLRWEPRCASCSSGPVACARVTG